ncbi:MAG: selenium-binding protein SBP56-related protein [Streptosporangiaceae bacterium]
MQVGGIGRERPHPAKPDAPLRGGPQMVEVSRAGRDGRRVYFTNSLYRAWDDQFYPAASGHGWPSSTPTRRAGCLRRAVLLRGSCVPRPAGAPGAPPRRRRLQRFLLFPVVSRPYRQKG